MMSQDFARYWFTVTESITLGTPGPADVDRIWACLDVVGLNQFFADMPSGLNTMLTTNFDGGLNLSGGEWQRLALARCLYRPSSRFFLLDEPTSAMDIDSAASFLPRMQAFAPDAGILVVTHNERLANSCDRLLELRNGRLILKRRAFS